MASLILRTTKSLLRKSNFENSPVVIEQLFIDHNKNIDIWIDEFIKHNIQNTYNNIFIPTNFGDNACDFLGIRLALHIRTTQGPNQLSNIFLYGPEPFEEITALCGFYKIILTKGVNLIDFSIESISKYFNTPQLLNSTNELISELIKIEVDIPDNYYDSHSISNVWGLYRLCEVAGVDINSITSFLSQKEKLNHIYFKWLLTVNRVDNLRSEEVVDAEKSYAPLLKGLTVLGKIDLPFDPKKKKINESSTNRR